MLQYMNIVPAELPHTEISLVIEQEALPLKKSW